MTINYTVKVDEEAVKETTAYFEFIGGKTEDALRVALNKTTPKIRTASSRAIREQVRLSASFVGGRLVIKKATRASLNAAIKVPERGMLLARYAADASVSGDKVSWLKPPLVPKSGIKVKIKPAAGSKILKGRSDTAGNKPFYILLNKGKTLAIAARLTAAGQAGGKIKIFNGPSLSQVFSGVRKDVMPAAGAELQLQLIDAMRYLLLKQNPPESP